MHMLSHVAVALLGCTLTLPALLHAIDLATPSTIYSGDQLKSGQYALDPVDGGIVFAGTETSGVGVVVGKFLVPYLSNITTTRLYPATIISGNTVTNAYSQGNSYSGLIVFGSTTITGSDITNLLVDAVVVNGSPTGGRLINATVLSTPSNITFTTVGYDGMSLNNNTILGPWGSPLNAWGTAVRTSFLPTGVQVLNSTTISPLSALINGTTHTNWTHLTRPSDTARFLSMAIDTDTADIYVVSQSKAPFFSGLNNTAGINSDPTLKPGIFVNRLRGRDGSILTSLALNAVGADDELSNTRAVWNSALGQLLLAIAGEDNGYTISHWSVVTGTALASFDVTDVVSAVAVTREGAVLVAGVVLSSADSSVVCDPTVDDCSLCSLTKYTPDGIVYWRRTWGATTTRCSVTHMYVDPLTNRVAILDATTTAAGTTTRTVRLYTNTNRLPLVTVSTSFPATIDPVFTSQAKVFVRNNTVLVTGMTNQTALYGYSTNAAAGQRSSYLIQMNQLLQVVDVKFGRATVSQAAGTGRFDMAFNGLTNKIVVFQPIDVVNPWTGATVPGQGWSVSTDALFDPVSPTTTTPTPTTTPTNGSTGNSTSGVSSTIIISAACSAAGGLLIGMILGYVIPRGKKAPRSTSASSLLKKEKALKEGANGGAAGTSVVDASTIARTNSMYEGGVSTMGGVDAYGNTMGMAGTIRGLTQVGTGYSSVALNDPGSPQLSPYMGTQIGFTNGNGMSMGQTSIAAPVMNMAMGNGVDMTGATAYGMAMQPTGQTAYGMAQPIYGMTQPTGQTAYAMQPTDQTAYAMQPTGQTAYAMQQGNTSYTTTNTNTAMTTSSVAGAGDTSYSAMGVPAALGQTYTSQSANTATASSNGSNRSTSGGY
jgi:hypothetical protein